MATCWVSWSWANLSGVSVSLIWADSNAGVGRVGCGCDLADDIGRADEAAGLLGGEGDGSLRAVEVNGWVAGGLRHNIGQFLQGGG